jgi:hypothetical protein
MDGETVLHRPQEKDTGQVEAWNGRTHGHRTCGNDQAVIREFACLPTPVGHRDQVGGRVDGPGCVVKEQVDPLAGDVFRRPMGQPVPIRRFAAKVEWQAADTVVGEAIGQDDSHLR